MSADSTPSDEDVWRQFEEVSAQLAEAFRPFVAAWLALRARLEEEGFHITSDPDMFPSVAPIQLEGFLPNGEPFYFRGRYDTCRLSIAQRGGDPIRAPAWHHQVSR